MFLELVPPSFLRNTEDEILEESVIQEQSEFKRALTERELCILKSAVLDELPGKSEFLVQIESIWVSDDSASPTIVLGMPESVPSAPIRKNILPVVIVELDEFEEIIAEVIIWLEDGKLSMIEYGYMGDEWPDELPDAAKLQIRMAEPRDASIFDF